MNYKLNLEIDQILQEFKTYFAFEENKNKDILSLSAKNEEKLKIYLEYLKEVEIFLKKKSFTFTSILDIKEVFKLIKKGNIISVNEIYEIKKLLELSNSFATNFSHEKELEYIYKDYKQIKLFNSLSNKINNIILPDLSISDDASISLKKIRIEKKEILKKIEDSFIYYKNKYHDYLSEDVLAFKNNFYSLPFKYNYRNIIEGSTISYSDTSKTAYVIPLNIIKMQNELNEISNLENKEIFDILKNIIDELKKNIDEIEHNYYLLLNLDYFFASYNYGLTYKGTRGNLSNDLKLNNLFHPSLKKSYVVTNSFSLSKDNKSMLFLSGPNAGGKSVLLKATCLSIIMFKLGLLIPCLDESYIPFIDKVFLVSGDNQSIENDLSTFSSHIKLIKEIIDDATNLSFVAIDEICEGTSPSDGEALAYSIVKYINNKNIFSIITSHYDLLKLYAQKNNKILSASMEFNIDTLLPTFHLILDSVSSSFGIELALNSGIKESIIHDAIENKKKQNSYKYEELNQKLNNEIKKSEKLNLILKEKEKELNDLIEKRKSAIISLEKEKEAIHNKAKDKIEKVVNKKMDELNILFDSNLINIPLNQKIEIKTALKQISNYEFEKKEEKEVKENIKEGDYVIDEESSLYKVLKVNKNKVILDSNGLKITRNIIGLKKSNYVKPKENKTNDYFINVKLDDNRSATVLNVIGLTCEEAEHEYKSFLSRAVIKKVHTVRIIHGIGSYKLKNTLWKLLENSPDIVESYRIGLENEGGFGATIVKLK